MTEISKLSEEQQDEIASWILEKVSDIETEAEWEEKIVTDALGDALQSNGDIDFDKLRARGLTLELDELYSENKGDDES